MARQMEQVDIKSPVFSFVKANLFVSKVIEDFEQEVKDLSSHWGRVRKRRKRGQRRWVLLFPVVLLVGYFINIWLDLALFAIWLYNIQYYFFGCKAV